MRIYLIGFMGSGKSHWGRLLSAGTGWPCYDLDQLIQEQEGMTIADIFSKKGEEYFRMLEREVLVNLSQTRNDMILSCGGGTPCFLNNIAFMKQQGKVVWLDTATPVLLKRLLKEKSHRPLIRDISDSDLEAFISRKLRDRKIYYEQADLRLPEETLTLQEMKKALFDDGK